jgi:hypothetical protein
MSIAHYGSSRHDRPHARLYDHHMAHPAWIGLSANAFKLITRLMAMWRPNKPNSFPAGGKTISELIGVDQKTVTRLVNELVEKGHLRIERNGRNRGQVKTRERVVSLTRYDTETSVGDPSYPIQVWREKMEQEKLPNEHGEKSGFGKDENLIKPHIDGENVVSLKTGSTRI